MKNTWKATAAFAAIVLCAGMSACGTSDASDSGKSSGTSSSSAAASFDPSTVETDETIAALVPDYVKKDGKLTVGTNTTYAPAEFIGEDGKTAVGYDVDLTKAIAKVMGLEPETAVSEFDMIIPSIGSKYDIGISSFTVTPERQEAVDFVTYYKAGSTWVTQKGNPDKVDTKDLCGVKVAVQTGTTQEEELNKMNEQCKADGKKAIELQTFAKQTDVTTAVVNGKAAVFYADSPVAGYAIEQTDGALAPLGADEGVTEEGIIVKKGDKQMDEAVQKAVQKLMDDGTYQKILENWGVSSGAIDKAEINPTK